VVTQDQERATIKDAHARTQIPRQTSRVSILPIPTLRGKPPSCSLDPKPPLHPCYRSRAAPTPSSPYDKLPALYPIAWIDCHCYRKALAAVRCGLSPISRVRHGPHVPARLAGKAGQRRGVVSSAVELWRGNVKEKKGSIGKCRVGQRRWDSY